MRVPDQYDFLCPSKVISGLAALENLPVELQALDANRPLVLASAEEKKGGALKKVMAAFRNSSMTVGVVDSVPGAPNRQTAKDLADFFHTKGHDAVVALGTGAVARVAKGLRLAAVHPERAVERAFFPETGAPVPLVPTIQVVTGPGDGFETSRFMTLGKKYMADADLMPDLVIIDPRAVTLPDGRGAAESALIALAHATEAAASGEANPLIATYAHAAVALVAENLQRALAKPEDKKAATALANAGVMAAVAFSNAPAGPAHRLATVAEGASGLSRAVFMGLTLPYSLAWAARRDKEAVGRLLLPLGGFDRYADTSEKRRAEAAVERVFEILRWVEDVDIMGPLTKNGLSEADLDAIARAAAEMSPSMDTQVLETVLADALRGGPVALEDR